MVKTSEGQLGVAGPVKAACGEELEDKQETRVDDQHSVGLLEAR